MTTVFLHIGIPKTGTTSIQYFLSFNRDALRESSLLYPKNLCSGGAHFVLSGLFGFGQKFESHEDDLLEMHREIEESRCQKIIFSSENFVLNGDVFRIKKEFKDYDFKIIVYLRRHDLWWPSAYQESVKQTKNPPWDKNFESFLDFQRKSGDQYWNYGALLDKWAAVFGTENIIARPFEKAQIGNNVVRDFFKSIDSEDIFEKFEDDLVFQNSSMSALSLQLVDIYQRIEIAEEVRARLINNALNLDCPFDASALCKSETLRSLVEENMNDYEYIAKKYLKRSDGLLFFEKIKLKDNKSYSLALKSLDRNKLAEITALALSRY